jgi:ribonucleoside-diphosphate reductase alpha chain
LAKNGVKLSGTQGNQLVHETFEAIQYYLLSASCDLAKSKGACEWFHETKYSQGLLPIDHYRKQLDSEEFNAKHPLLLDWEALRERIKTYGLRNSTLTAQMPCETSSQITNSTNGIEPPRAAVSIKASKEGAIRMVVPEYERLKDEYEYLWDMPNNYGYLTKVAIIQKFFDQSISTNTNYDPTRFASGKVPMDVLIEDLLTAFRLGVKTMYYHNTRDGAGKVEDDKPVDKVAAFLTPNAITTNVTHQQGQDEYIEPDSDCDGGCKI